MSSELKDHIGPSYLEMLENLQNNPQQLFSEEFLRTAGDVEMHGIDLVTFLCLTNYQLLQHNAWLNKVDDGELSRLYTEAGQRYLIISILEHERFGRIRESAIQESFADMTSQATDASSSIETLTAECHTHVCAITALYSTNALNRISKTSAYELQKELTRVAGKLLILHFMHYTRDQQSRHEPITISEKIA